MEAIKDFFNNFGTHFEAFAEKYFYRILLCIGVVLLALLLKFIFSAIVRRIARRYAERKGVTEVGQSEEAEYAKKLANVFLPPLRLLLITAAFCASALLLFEKDGAPLDFCLRVTRSLLVVCIFVFLSHLCDFLVFLYLYAASKKGGPSRSLGAKYLATVLRVVIYVFGTLTILQQWIDNITGLLAGLSIGGVAFALAAQDTAANLFGAATVIFDRPFEIGNIIEVDGVTGTVIGMGLRSTKLMLLDQSIAIIPNSKMSSSRIINWTMLDHRRIDVELGITYDTPAAKIKEFTDALRELLQSDEDVVKGSQCVWFAEFSDFSLTIKIKYLAVTPDLGESNLTREKINLKIAALADSMGVEFAFPTNTVYLNNPEK